MQLSQRSLDALAAARDAAQALLEAGNVSRLDAASQIAAYQRTRADVARLELEVAERREEVQRLLGLHGEHTGWEIRDGLADAPEELSIADDFERIALEPAQKRTVSFTLRPEQLAFYDQRMRRVVEPGFFTVWVGTSSADERHQARFEVTGRLREIPR